MSDICLWIGRAFCAIGGVAVAAAILALAIWLLQGLWADVFWRFRAIKKEKNLYIKFTEHQKAFNLYLENREEFIRWQVEKNKERMSEREKT